jgi:hypothetical protein
MKKTWLGFREVDFFGFKISAGQVRMHPSKLQKIQELPFPTNKAMAQKVNGVLQFSSRLIPNFHLYSPILSDMMKDNFDWDRETWKHVPNTCYGENISSCALIIGTCCGRRSQTMWLLCVGSFI